MRPRTLPMDGRFHHDAALYRFRHALRFANRRRSPNLGHRIFGFNDRDATQEPPRPLSTMLSARALVVIVPALIAASTEASTLNVT
jgi:hypothetical protein